MKIYYMFIFKLAGYDLEGVLGDQDESQVQEEKQKDSIADFPQKANIRADIWRLSKQVLKLRT
jgi:hypothetical protein